MGVVWLFLVVLWLCSFLFFFSPSVFRCRSCCAAPLFMWFVVFTYPKLSEELARPANKYQIPMYQCLTCWDGRVHKWSSFPTQYAAAKHPREQENTWALSRLRPWELTHMHRFTSVHRVLFWFGRVRKFLKNT